MSDSQQSVDLMRGLPGCGKSHRVRRLAGERGLVLETDQYFYSMVGDNPASYDDREELLGQARDWNFERFCSAVDRSISSVVVDRGNGLNSEIHRFAAYAVERGYLVSLAEPDSPWWLELRVLLKYKRFVQSDLFDLWARRLADSTRDGHRVPAATIRHWMERGKYDLSVEDILDWTDGSDSW